MSITPDMVAQLPIELLQLILHDATPESLRSFRLVNRQWSAASSPYLFERIHASLFRKPLANLTALSLSPLAKHVKAIDYHSDQLPAYSRREWESQLDFRPDYVEWLSRFGEDTQRLEISRAYNKLPKHELTPAQLEAGWLVYQSHYRDQQSWVDAASGLALRDCLPRFLNLREVVIDQAKPFQRRDHDKSYWNHFLKEALVKRNAWMYENHDERLAALSSLFMVIAVGHRSCITDMKPVEVLLLDLPSEYSLCDMIYSPPHYPLKDRLRQLPGSTDPSQVYQTILGAFRPLKDLTIQFPSVEDVEAPESKSQMQELNDILTASTNLESLSLDMGEPNRSYEGANEEENHTDHGLVQFMSRYSRDFPNLKELRISGSFPSNPFITFLTMHQRTLKKLDIRDSFSDNWYRVFEYIGRFLKPEHIYVESLWQPILGADMLGDPDMLLPEGLDDDNDFARDVKRYLYTGSGPMPVSYEYGMSDDYDSEMESYVMADPDEWDPEVDYSGLASDDADTVEDYSGGRPWYYDETMEERFARKDVERAGRWARWRAADEARLAGRAD